MGVDCELRYIDTPEEQRLENIRRRNEAVRNGAPGFQVRDEDAAHFFDAPEENEIAARVKPKFV